ncbi:hypothetical protein [Nocardia sp. NPDC051981]|uniref:hypothetical protein n=1 Tax=Nocardia sp. NPDC051981 TaxID=3155417 RepID=UPI0034497C62
MSGRYVPARDAEWKKIAPHVHMFLPGTIHIEDEPHPGWKLSFELDFDGVRVAPLAVHIASTGAAISGTDLRAIAVNEVLAGSLTAGADLVGFLAHDEGWTLVPTEEDKERIRREGPTPENVECVAAHFLYARATRTPASEYVQFQFGLPKPTAARWLRKAREMGLIDGDD